jgi:hypothetical protein
MKIKMVEVITDGSFNELIVNRINELTINRNMLLDKPHCFIVSENIYSTGYVDYERIIAIPLSYDRDKNICEIQQLLTPLGIALFDFDFKIEPVFQIRNNEKYLNYFRAIC